MDNRNLASALTLRGFPNGLVEVGYRPRRPCCNSPVGMESSEPSIMADPMNQHRIYRLTSIGRPLDRSYATNRAVSRLMPLAGIAAGAAAALRGDSGAQIAVAVLAGVIVVFGAWALARELVPDDNPAAFLSMVLAFATLLLVDSPSLLLLVATLLLVRIVNRSVGLAARISDSILAVGLNISAIYSTHSPLLGVVGALAFAFDALLRDGQRHQWVFAALCLAGTGVFGLQHGIGVGDAAPLPGLVLGSVAAISVLYVVMITLTRRIDSSGDATGAPLSLSRVRGGMVIGLLAASQALILGPSGVNAASIVWATLAGVAVARVRTSFSGGSTVSVEPSDRGDPENRTER